MRAAKLAMITLFLLMAIGGVGGLMLVGYTVILHAG
ncbi:TPA: protein YohO [Citrobacter freundii]